MLLLRLGSLDSTQSFLRRHPELGSCGVLAGSQTAGRGRWGNRWESEAGAGLYLSAAMPDPGLPPGLALQGAMRHLLAFLGTPSLGLKWPNDLVAWKQGRLVKLGGIIGEVAQGRLILGLGVNLRGAPELQDGALPAQSLAGLGLPIQDPERLAGSLLEAWQDLAAAPEPGFRWPAVGEAVRWQEGQGVVLGWEEDGRLRLASRTGIVRLAAGEVSGLRPEA
jgi:BirA family transcriptional regulator, biotin operon repressor / biotin---[acetyl-CoA-carboxylase] ligase